MARPEIHRCPELANVHTKDGQRVIAVYARGAAITVILIPADATRWEETAAARIVTERAAGKAFAMVTAEELPPRPVAI